jgi:hypothetical protein
LRFVGVALLLVYPSPIAAAYALLAAELRDAWPVLAVALVPSVSSSSPA